MALRTKVTVDKVRERPIEVTIRKWRKKDFDGGAQGYGNFTMLVTYKKNKTWAHLFPMIPGYSMIRFQKIKFDIEMKCNEVLQSVTKIPSIS